MKKSGLFGFQYLESTTKNTYISLPTLLCEFCENTKIGSAFIQKRILFVCNIYITWNSPFLLWWWFCYGMQLCIKEPTKSHTLIYHSGCMCGWSQLSVWHNTTILCVCVFRTIRCPLYAYYRYILHWFSYLDNLLASQYLYTIRSCFSDTYIFLWIFYCVSIYLGFVLRFAHLYYPAKIWILQIFTYDFLSLA